MPLGVVSDAEFAAELANSCDNADGRSPTSTDLDSNEVVDDENLATENGDSAANAVGSVEELRRGRGKDNPNTPLALQQLIGEAAISSRKESVELASLLGISPSSASAYANGSSSTATYNKPKLEIADFLDKKKKTISKRASHKLLSALDNITEDKLSSAKLSDLATVAKSMSGIIKDMEPTATPNPFGNTFNGPSIVMFAPPLVDESRFQAITVQE